eukprot:3816395-Alexandrium_andersonii.AAC.1
MAPGYLACLLRRANSDATPSRKAEPFAKASWLTADTTVKSTLMGPASPGEKMTMLSLIHISEPTRLALI